MEAVPKVVLNSRISICNPFKENDNDAKNVTFASEVKSGQTLTVNPS